MEVAELRSELRRQLELHRVTQLSLEESRNIVAGLREERQALTGRLARAEATAKAMQSHAMSVTSDKDAEHRELSRLIRANEDLEAALMATKSEIKFMRSEVEHSNREESSSHAAAVHRSDSFLSTSSRASAGSLPKPLHHSSVASLGSPSPTRSGSLLRIEHGDVSVGDAVKTMSRSADGTTTFRSASGTEVHVSMRDGMHVDVVPPPSDSFDALHGVSSSRLLSARSQSSARSPSPGVARLQERLQKVRDTFAQLRETPSGVGDHQR
jgi:hypothetical protein